MGNRRRRRRRHQPAWWQQQYGGMPVWGLLAAVVVVVGGLTIAALNLPGSTTANAQATAGPVPTFSLRPTADCSPGDPGLTATAEAVQRDPGSVTIAVLGDSTRAEDARPAFARALRKNLPGVEVISFGSNGSSLARYVEDTDRQQQIRDADPTTIELSIGINDLRLGQTSAEEFEGDLVAYVEDLHTDLPETEIILSVPAALSTRDINATGYLVGADGTVNPDGMAQQMTEDLRAAYRSAKEQLPYITLVDVQSEITGTLADSGEKPKFLADQIHPNQETAAEIAGLVARTIVGDC